MPTTFADLQLSPGVLEAIGDLGFEEPTPIQDQTIRPLIEGRDVIAQAQTGTGKTAAFAIPIVECVDPQELRVQAIVLAPTRELAVQDAEATHRLGRVKGVSVLPIYGGQPIYRQLHALARGVQVVIGTPGRVLDHLRRGSLTLDAVRFVVLDEADEMLDMGFVEDIESILDAVPSPHQTALFSATIPPRIAHLAEKYLNDPVRISIAPTELTVPAIDQFYVPVTARNKLDVLARLLDHEMPESAIIFARTKRDVDELGEALQARGFAAETLHGDLNQVQRDRVMSRFRGGQVELLVATDVAARGLDISGVTHVFNYAIPEDPEAYVHRIGRTGRAGRTGQAITLVQPHEIRLLRLIERMIRRKITPQRLPTVADVEARRRELLKAALRDEIQAGNLDGYMVVVEDLAEEFDLAEIAAAAAKLSASGGRPVTEIAEPPPPPPRPAPSAAGAGGPLTRITLNVGRAEGVRPADVVGAIANEAGIPGRTIGNIDIYDEVTVVEIPEADRDRVIAALRSATIRGRHVQAAPLEAGTAPPPRTTRPQRATPHPGARPHPGHPPVHRPTGKPHPVARKPPRKER